MRIRLYGQEKYIKTLGPGRRYVIWVQGCDRRCPGCMSVETRDRKGGYLIDIEELADQVLKSGCDGLTISGGEPFLQAEELAYLIGCIRKKKDLGVILYTGYTLEELRVSNESGVNKLMDCCDLLIDGPYVEKQNDGKNLRGSSNQRVIPLTSRYEKEAPFYGTKEAEVEFILSEDRIRMVGIPTAAVLKRFREAFGLEDSLLEMSDESGGMRKKGE